MKAKEIITGKQEVHPLGEPFVEIRHHGNTHWTGQETRVRRGLLVYQGGRHGLQVQTRVQVYPPNKSQPQSSTRNPGLPAWLTWHLELK